MLNKTPSLSAAGAHITSTAPSVCVCRSVLNMLHLSARKQRLLTQPWLLKGRLYQETQVNTEDLITATALETVFHII